MSCITPDFFRLRPYWSQQQLCNSTMWWWLIQSSGKVWTIFSPFVYMCQRWHARMLPSVRSLVIWVDVPEEVYYRACGKPNVSEGCHMVFIYDVVRFDQEPMNTDALVIQDTIDLHNKDHMWFISPWSSWMNSQQQAMDVRRKIINQNCSSLQTIISF